MYGVLVVCEDGGTFMLNCDLSLDDAIAVRDGFNESGRTFDKAYVIVEERSY